MADSSTEAMPMWQFLHELGKYRKEHPAERQGQALFNYASICFGDRFETDSFRRSGPLDPFYVDDHTGVFLKHLIVTGCLGAE